MKRTSKMVAVLLAILISFGMGYSAHYISSNTHHECSEEACPICEQLSIAEGILQKISTAVIIMIGVFLVCNLAHIFVSQYNCVILYQSPIQVKVKLLN